MEEKVGKFRSTGHKGLDDKQRSLEMDLRSLG